jgi:hypothetical protein
MSRKQRRKQRQRYAQLQEQAKNLQLSQTTSSQTLPSQQPSTTITTTIPLSSQQIEAPTATTQTESRSDLQRNQQTSALVNVQDQSSTNIPTSTTPISNDSSFSIDTKSTVSQSNTLEHSSPLLSQQSRDQNQIITTIHSNSTNTKTTQTSTNDNDQIKIQYFKDLRTIDSEITKICSVSSGLYEFTAPELLDGDNCFRCFHCTKLYLVTSFINSLLQLSLKSFWCRVSSHILLFYSNNKVKISEILF